MEPVEVVALVEKSIKPPQETTETTDEDPQEAPEIRLKNPPAPETDDPLEISIEPATLA
jgi:hypothetical protein